MGDFFSGLIFTGSRALTKKAPVKKQMPSIAGAGYCSNFGEYIEKGMRGNILSQIKEVRKIKEAIPEVQERKNKITRTRKEIDWWD